MEYLGFKNIIELSNLGYIQSEQYKQLIYGGMLLWQMKVPT
uniref:Uncharacterized protein n=1 Tax=Geladintestivirus 1 TaxID=3233133 RepID=A0AAU8MLD3_9CAUD